MMGSKILLADDSITIQKVVNLTFADEGIDVVTVSNGEMAERRLAEINPDLVLADIFMPGRNGYELCQYVKESPQFKNTPVVLLVGAFEPFDQAEAKRVRADAHLTKPFESRTLVDTVRRLIQGRPKTGPLHSGPLQTAGVKETRRLDEQPAAQHVASPFDSTVSYGAPGPVEFSGFGQASPSFPLIDDTPPAAPQAPQASSQPEPFSVGYNPMWQGQETGAEHNTQELPTISIELGEPGEPGEPAEQHRVPEFNPSSLTAEADAAESAAQEQGFSFSMVQPPAESQTVAAPVEPIPFEPTVAAQFDSVQAVPEPPPLEDFVPEQLSSPEPTGFAVPSLFEDAQNPMIDFDVVGEEAVSQDRVSPAEDLPVPPPIPLQESAPVAFEVDFGDTLPLPPTLEQRVVSHTDQTALAAPVEEPQSLAPAWPQSQEEAPLAVSFAPDSATAFEVSGIETVEPAKSEPEPEPQPLKSEGYFTEEEPLGDVLTEEALTEEALTEVEPSDPSIPIVSAPVAVEAAPPINFALSESTESGFSVDLSEAREDTVEAKRDADRPVLPQEQPEEESASAHSFGGKTSPQTSRTTGELDEQPAHPAPVSNTEETPAELETGFAFAETEKQVISFQPVSMEPERIAEPVAASPEPVPEAPFSDQFTSSGMWAADAKFSPIDIEASPESEPLKPVEAMDEAASLPVAPPAPDLAAELGAASFEPQPPADESGFAIVRHLSETAETIDVQSASEEPETMAVAHTGTNGDSPAGGLSAEAINEIVKRVVAELSDSVVREIAWEVVPDCVERVVERLSRESLSKRM